MKKIIAAGLIVLAALLPIVAGAQAPQITPFSTENITPRGALLQSAAGATGNGNTLNTSLVSTVALQITGTFSGTVAPETSVDGGTTWVAVTCFPAGSSSGVTTMTTASTWRCSVAGFPLFRARVSVWSSGSITVRAFGTTLPFYSGTSAQ